MRSETIDKIWLVLRNFPRGATVAQVARRVGALTGHTKTRLDQMVDAGMIVRAGDGRYGIKSRMDAHRERINEATETAQKVQAEISNQRLEEALQRAHPDRRGVKKDDRPYTAKRFHAEPVAMGACALTDA